MISDHNCFAASFVSLFYVVVAYKQYVSELEAFLFSLVSYLLLRFFLSNLWCAVSMFIFTIFHFKFPVFLHVHKTCIKGHLVQVFTRSQKARNKLFETTG